MFRTSKRIVALTVATCAISAGTASARVPHEPPPAHDAASPFAHRPCSHALRVDRRTGRPIGPITTYGARCVVA